MLPKSAKRAPVGWRVHESTPIPESRLERVRFAAAAFMRGTTLGWGRRDLAEWLVCQYAPCTVKPEEDVEELLRRTAPSGHDIRLDDMTVERVVLDARARALRLLADLVVPWQASPIARLAVASGIVLSQRDPRGGIAHAPVDLPGMRLGERIASLFIADYLNRPTEYRWVMMCRECGELAFATEIAHAESCEAAPEQWFAFTPADAILIAAGA